MFLFEIQPGDNAIVVLIRTPNSLPPLVGLSLETVESQSNLLCLWNILEDEKMVDATQPLGGIIPREMREFEFGRL